MDNPMFKLFYILLLTQVVATAIGDSTDIDKEIIRDFEFFYHMDTVENQELIELDLAEESIDKTRKGVSSESP